MIIIIDNYDSFTYNLYQMAAQLYANVVVIRHDKISVQAVLNQKPLGIILSPGPGRPETAGICIDLIRAAKNIPLLGVCLGLQAMVVAEGGEVIQAPEIKHGKQDFIFHKSESCLYKAISSPFLAGRYHSLMAAKASLPANLVVDAYTQDNLIMGIRHIKRPMFGVQFHPESILTPMGSQLLKNFIQQCEISI